MRKQHLVITAVGVLALLGVYAATATACTGIRLIAKDGAVVYGRTLEWGTFDIKSRLAVFPRGYEFESTTPDGKPGHR